MTGKPFTRSHQYLSAAALFLIISLVPAEVPAMEEEAAQAETEGRWEDAVTLWKALADEGGRREKTQFLRILEVTGGYDELENAARKTSAEDPAWDIPVLYLSRSLSHRGKLEQASSTLDPWMDRSLPAMAEKARVLELQGNRGGLTSLMERVATGYEKKRNRSPRDHLAAGEAAHYLGDFELAARLFETAYRDSVGFLEARLRLGYLFRDKYQGNLAAEEVAAATRLAPNHPDVHLAQAWLGLQTTRLAQAEEEALRVLEVRPLDPRARSILSVLALIADDPAQALEWIAESVRERPFDLDLRTNQAAAFYLQGDQDGFDRAADEILDTDPGYFDVFLKLAWILEKSRRNEEAFALYDRVLAADPRNSGALIGKGLLSMREGWEKEARGYLERGFANDPFNIRAYNQLELLDHMDTFTHYRTDHFDIRMEAAKDSLLVPLLEDRLESIYRELTALHGWAPDIPTVVEVFPSHDWFSARVTGFPVLSGIPAVCFGDVIAMDSPRTLAGQSNWEDILRHEYGHVLALGMTRKKVPFWFTEGLSVHLEHFPRGPNWDANLVGAYLDGGLVSLDSLTIAFTRPRNSSQRLLAYHQASLIIGDLVERRGWDTIPALLRAFGEGTSLARALEDIGENYTEFAARAMAVARSEAAGIHIWPAPNPERLVRLQNRDPELRDVAYHELLALTQFQFQLGVEATETATKLLELDPNNPRGHGILGLLDLGAKRNEPAHERLNRAVSSGSVDIPVHEALARLEVARGDTAAAMAALDRALTVYPGAVQSLRMRGDLHLARGHRDLAIRDYQDLIDTEGAAGVTAVRLARLHLADKRGPEAAAALDYARGIRALDAEVTALHGQALLLLERDREAYEQFLAARRLDRRNIDSMVGMALYYLKQGDLEEAAYFAGLALKYDPEQADALRVLSETGLN